MRDNCFGSEWANKILLENQRECVAKKILFRGFTQALKCPSGNALTFYKKNWTNLESSRRSASSDKPRIVYVLYPYRRMSRVATYRYAGVPIEKGDTVLRDHWGCHFAGGSGASRLCLYPPYGTASVKYEQTTGTSKPFSKASSSYEQHPPGQGLCVQ